MKRILFLSVIVSLLLPPIPLAVFAASADFKITEVRIGSDNGPTMRDFYVAFTESAKEVSVDIAKNIDGAIWKTFSYQENLYQAGQKSFAVTISPLEENSDYKYTVNGRRVSDGKWAPVVDGAFTTKSGVSALVISNVKVQKLTDLEEGVRDFSYSISTQNKTAATLTITDKSTNSIIFTKVFTDSAPYVSGLDPSSDYAYRIDIVDQVTGTKGSIEGVFSTDAYGKTISRERCNENNPWKTYCAADGTEKLISSCEASALGARILHQGSCTAADLKPKTNESKIVVGLDRIYQAGQIANEETLDRDFAFNISGVDRSKANTKLEVFDVVTGAKHPEENYIQAHNVVTKLKPNTSYRYVYTVTDPATGRSGSAEGTFRTADITNTASVKPSLQKSNNDPERTIEPSDFTKIKSEAESSLKETSSLKKALKTYKKPLQFFGVNINALNSKIDPYIASLKTVMSAIEQNNDEDTIEAYNDVEPFDATALKDSILLMQKNYSILKRVQNKKIKQELLGTRSLIADMIHQGEYEEAYEGLLIFTKEIKKNEALYLAKKASDKNQKKILNALKKLEEVIQQEK